MAQITFCTPSCWLVRFVSQSIELVVGSSRSIFLGRSNYYFFFLLPVLQNDCTTFHKFLHFFFIAGGAVDMFYRYGFFSLSVRVVPRDDPGRWLIREPTANIFEPRSVVHNDVAGPDTFARQPIQVRFI